MAMDGLVSDDIFSLPLVLPSPALNQQVGLINCSGWQQEVGKDQTFPLMILENGELSLRNVGDLPLFLGSSLSEENVILGHNFISHIEPVEKTLAKENSSSAKEIKKEEVTSLQVKNESNDNSNIELQVNETNDISESCLMDNLVETVIMYKCKLCTFKSTEKRLLGVHIRTVHLKMNSKKDEPIIFTGGEHCDSPSASWANGEGQTDQLIYMCGSCNEAFAGFTECRIHMAQHHKIMMGSKPSSRTDEISQSNKETDEPSPKQEEKGCEKKESDKRPETTIDAPCERTIECEVSGCQTKFSTRWALSKHRDCHSPDNPRQFVCSYCSTVFTRWSLCANHLWRIHTIDIELFSCTECKYKTATRVKMKNHVQIHGKCKDYMCNECGKMFSQQPQLRNHEVTHLKSKPEDERPRWYTKKECEQCGKMFANSKSLKKHVQAVHSKLRPYVCHVCGHSSAAKNMLQMHLRQHTGEKPFSCPTCPFTTGDHNSLRRHRMRHSGVRPYRCPHCPYSSIQTGSLKHHLSTWHQADIKKEPKPGKGRTVEAPADSTSSDSFVQVNDPLAFVETNFSTMEFDLQADQVVSKSGNDGFKKDPLDIILSQNEQNSKEMVIQIPVSPGGMNYLKHTLDSVTFD